MLKNSRKKKEKGRGVEQIVYCRVSNCYTLRLIISTNTTSFSRPPKNLGPYIPYMYVMRANYSSMINNTASPVPTDKYIQNRKIYTIRKSNLLEIGYSLFFHCPSKN